jgi:hypothetical protein
MGLIPGAARARLARDMEFEMELQCRMGKLGPYADLDEVTIEIMVGISVPNYRFLSHSQHVPPIFSYPSM